MLPEQKRAWCAAVVCVVAVVGFVALFPVRGVQGWSALGLAGLAALTPLLFRARSKRGEVASDERDEMVLERATLAAFATSTVWFALACMGFYFLCMLRGEKEISIEVLPFICIAAVALHFGVRAVCVLHLYREHGADENN